MKSITPIFIFLTIIIQVLEGKSFGELNRNHHPLFPKHPAFPSHSESSSSSFPGEEAHCGSIHKLKEGDVIYFRNKENNVRQIRSPFWPQKGPHHSVSHHPVFHHLPYSPFNRIPYTLPRYRSNQYVRPRICAWKFYTESSCQLVSTFDHYETGDLNCNRQYILLADEERDLQVCGYAPSPGIFKSFGKTLTIKHLRKPQVWSSEFEGHVTCVKSKLQSEVIEFGSSSVEALGDKEDIYTPTEGHHVKEPEKSEPANEIAETSVTNAIELEQYRLEEKSGSDKIINSAPEHPKSYPPVDDEIDDEFSGSGSGDVKHQPVVPASGYGYPVDPEDSFDFEGDTQNINNGSQKVNASDSLKDAESPDSKITSEDGLPKPKPVAEPPTETESSTPSWNDYSNFSSTEGYENTSENDISVDAADTGLMTLEFNDVAEPLDGNYSATPESTESSTDGYESSTPEYASSTDAPPSESSSDNPIENTLGNPGAANDAALSNILEEQYPDKKEDLSKRELDSDLNTIAAETAATG